MADLNDVEKRIAELKAEVAPTLKEIEALEHAAMVLKSLDEKTRVFEPKPLSLEDLTIPQAAEMILEAYPKGLHYRQITEIALGSGFTGKRLSPDAPASKVAESFRRMMGQQPNVFESLGDGIYRLVATPEPVDVRFPFLK